MSEPASPVTELPSDPPLSQTVPVSEPLVPEFTLAPWAPPLIFLLLALVFLSKCIFTGSVFLPATLLGHVAPWKSTTLYPQLPAWNPLRWDGIGQFYPWRKFAADTIRSGAIPLWNPYQFCGTPFVANSQSAVFYPGNVLFLLIPDAAYAFGWNAVLHLALCGWFMYLLLRRIRCSEAAALAGGVVYAFSAWQVAWLQLPTFLATSCWFPLLLRQMYGFVPGTQTPVLSASGRPDAAVPAPEAPVSPTSGLAACCSVAGVVAMMLLAGHLQIAMYGLLAGACFGIGLIVTRRVPLRAGVPWIAGSALGLMLAMPQLLPAIELSRISHRVSRPSAAGYAAYTDYALPAPGVIQLLLPDFFGGDTDPANPYWAYYRLRLPGGQQIAVYHNPAETAIYVGIAPLVFALLACWRGAVTRGRDARTMFFALLGLLALLLALGTPLNALFYFGIPGFAQSGSPARCIVLWSLAIAGLAALGIDQARRQAAVERELATICGVIAALAVVGVNLGARASMQPPPGIERLPVIGEVFARLGSDWLRLGLFTAAALIVLARPWLRTRSGPASLPVARFGGVHPMVAAAVPGVIIGVDLFWAGMGANPTAQREQVYPPTKGIAYLQEHAGHNRVLPLNQRWSLFATAPFALPDVLPPNAATVFHLRDVQGYDSLFAGRYKAYANLFARPNRLGQLDASPIEVGNIVFFQNANSPRVVETGAAYAVAIPYDQPGFAQEAAPNVTPQDTGDPGMMIYEMPRGGGRVRLDPSLTGSALEWLDDSPTCIRLRAQSPSPAVLTLRDSALPGWRLWVDGRAAPILTSRDHPVSRSAEIPAGRHDIVFRYEPASFRLGVYLSGAALCAVSLLLGLSAVGGSGARVARR